jgi:hypothetical protein
MVPHLSCIVWHDQAMLFSSRGQFSGKEQMRLAVLKYAAMLGAAYVDVEYLAAQFFFAGELLLLDSLMQKRRPCTTQMLPEGHQMQGMLEDCP